MRHTEIQPVNVGGKLTNGIYTNEIQRKMGIQVGVQLLKQLGFKPLFEESTRVLWLADSYQEMCYSLASYIAGRADK